MEEEQVRGDAVKVLLKPKSQSWREARVGERESERERERERGGRMLFVCEGERERASYSVDDYQ